MNSKCLWKEKDHLKNRRYGAIHCVLSFKDWRVPVVASWLRVASRWREDSETNSKSFDMSGTSHSQEESPNMCKHCFLNAHGKHWQNLEEWQEIECVAQEMEANQGSNKGSMMSKGQQTYFEANIWGIFKCKLEIYRKNDMNEQAQIQRFRLETFTELGCWDLLSDHWSVDSQKLTFYCTRSDECIVKSFRLTKSKDFYLFKGTFCRWQLTHYQIF